MPSSYFNKNKITIFFFLVILNSICITKSNIAMIEVYSSLMRVELFYTGFIEESISNDDYGPEDIVKTIGKICNANRTQNLFTDCFLKYENFNYDWIILANTSDYLASVYSFKEQMLNNSTYPFKIVSIIFNNETIHNVTIDSTTPTFSVSSAIYDDLIKYDIFNHSDNWTINLLYSRMNFYSQISITFYLSILLAILMLTSTLIWHILSWCTDSSHSTPIQKGFTVLIYLRLMLCFLTIYFVYLNMKTFNVDNFADGLTKIYVETIIVTLNAVLQTLVWFNIIIVAFGWQIHRGMFTRNELRNFVIVFILLYLLICFDQIFDMLIQYKVWKFKPSDIKNFILYTAFCFIVVRYCERSKQIVRRRGIYALNFSREYFPALRLKLKMMNYHIIATLIYSTLYLTVIILTRTVLQDFITNVMKIVILDYTDILGFLMFATIYCPRKLPDYFTVFYDDLLEHEDNKFSIYAIKLSCGNVLRDDIEEFTTPIWSEKVSKKEIKEIKESHTTPVVIINPSSINFDENMNGNWKGNSFNIMDYVNVAFISKN